MSVSDIPDICGVGGGLTHGTRSGNIALHAEFQGAIAVVLNAPTPRETIEYVKETIDIPVVVTVVSEHTDVQSRIDAGADILNVSGRRKKQQVSFVKSAKNIQRSQSLQRVVQLTNQFLKRLQREPMPLLILHRQMENSSALKWIIIVKLKIVFNTTNPLIKFMKKN